MKPTSRSISKWRKKSPASHRSYAEKRNRLDRQALKDIQDGMGRNRLNERLEKLGRGYYE